MCIFVIMGNSSVFYRYEDFKGSLSYEREGERGKERIVVVF